MGGGGRGADLNYRRRRPLALSRLAFYPPTYGGNLRKRKEGKLDRTWCEIPAGVSFTCHFFGCSAPRAWQKERFTPPRPPKRGARWAMGTRLVPEKKSWQRKMGVGFREVLRSSLNGTWVLGIWRGKVGCGPPPRIREHGPQTGERTQPGVEG